MQATPREDLNEAHAYGARVRAGRAGACPDIGGSAGLSVASDQVRRAVHRRQRHRYARARPGPEAQCDAGLDGIENMAGASGQTAASNVARAVPDGHTVFVTSNTTHAANQNLFKKLSYDPIGDFAPITRLGDITLALALHPSIQANNVRELIAYGKANPGKLSFGAGSTSSRMASELLKARAGFEMLHVPYRANPLAVADLLGGQVSLVFADVS